MKNLIQKTDDVLNDLNRKGKEIIGTFPVYSFIRQNLRENATPETIRNTIFTKLPRLGVNHFKNVKS